MNTARLCPSCRREFDGIGDASHCPACQSPLALSERYLLERELGRGGQGATYAGLDTAHDDRAVAIKELSVAQARDWKSIELFDRSARVLEHLDDPGLPAIYDAFEESRGGISFYYVVQELIDGISLQQALDRGERFTAEEAFAIAEEMARILIYLHEQQPPIIHRDVKPANIMRRHDGSLVLIDFGLVRDTGSKGSTMMMGTPGFAPLEQFMGRAQPATDLYGLGATLVALMTRRDPSDLLDDQAKLGFREHLEQLNEADLVLLDDLCAPRLEDRLSSARELRRRLRQRGKHHAMVSHLERDPDELEEQESSLERKLAVLVALTCMVAFITGLAGGPAGLGVALALGFVAGSSVVVQHLVTRARPQDDDDDEAPKELEHQPARELPAPENDDAPEAAPLLERGHRGVLTTVVRDVFSHRARSWHAEIALVVEASASLPRELALHLSSSLEAVLTAHSLRERLGLDPWELAGQEDDHAPSFCFEAGEPFLRGLEDTLGDFGLAVVEMTVVPSRAVLAPGPVALELDGVALEP